MKERIAYLFNQFYYNKSDRKELDELFQIIHTAKNDEEINHLIKEVYEEIKRSNPSLTYIGEDGKLVLQEPDWLYQTQQDQISVPARRVKIFLQIAAACLVLIISGVVFWMFRQDPVPRVETALVQKFTERAEHKFLLLSDSTQVWLNSSSTISYPEHFNSKKREVHLVGEAYFDVKHADKIPFIIHTGEVTTVVLGTAFNVKAYDGQLNITISVKRGKVQVMRHNKVVFTLTKGQETKIGRKNAYDDLTELGDSNKVGSWQHGYLSYDDENFGDIVSDMERVYNAEIIVKNTELKKLMVTTSFNRDIGVKKALEILCKLTDSKLEFTDNQYLIR